MSGGGQGPLDWRQQPVDAMQAPHQQQDERLRRLQQEHLLHQRLPSGVISGLGDGLASQLQQQQQQGVDSAGPDAVLMAQRRALLQLRQQVAVAAAKQQFAAAQQVAQESGQALGGQVLSGQVILGQTIGGTSGTPATQPLVSAASQQSLPGQDQLGAPLLGPVLEVESDLLEKEGDRVVSALNGGRAERAWALNALCLLSFRQEIHLGATPGLLAALLPVLQEGLADAVGLSNGAHSTAPDPDAQREAAGLPPLPGWQARRAARLAGDLFLDHARLQERLQEAAAAAVVLRNAAEAQQNSALLLDPPVMRCWTWSLNAARELVLQQHAGGEASSIAGGGGPTASGGGPTASAGGGDGTGPSQAEPQPQEERQQQQEQPLAGLVVGGGPAADICTSLLQLTTVLSGRMLLPAFFECGMLLLRSLLILLRPTWQQTTSGGAVLPPPLVSLAALAVTAVATAYQPNTDILLSMTSGPGQPGAPGQPGTPGQPGATLMQVVADLLVCPFEVFRQHVAQQVDEESPGWRHLLPTDAQLLAEARRGPQGGAGGGSGAGNGSPDDSLSTAELCILDMMSVLSQLRYLSATLTLLWRLLTAAEPAGAHARAAAASCPRLLSMLCEIAVHRWPQHPVRWHADGHTLRHPDAYPAYLRFLSHDMMPAMRERQELLQPLRADAAALLALLAADPETRNSVAWCEGQVCCAVMSGVVPPGEPGVSALLARFAAQAAGTGAAGARGAGAAGAGGMAGAVPVPPPAGP